MYVYKLFYIVQYKTYITVIPLIIILSDQHSLNLFYLFNSNFHNLTMVTV